MEQTPIKQPGTMRKVFDVTWKVLAAIMLVIATYGSVTYLLNDHYEKTTPPALYSYVCPTGMFYLKYPLLQSSFNTSEGMCQYYQSYVRDFDFRPFNTTNVSG